MLGPLLMMGASGDLFETVVLDSFNRANGAIGTADVGGAWSTVESGGTGSAWSITSNTAYQSTNLSGGAGRQSGVVIDSGETDIDVTLDVTTAQTGTVTGAGILFRFDDFANLWRLIFATNFSGTISWYLQRRVANTTTTLASGTPAALTGSLRVLDNGSTIRAFIDGTQVGMVADSSLNTNTKQGITVAYDSVGAQSGTGWRFDNHEVKAR